MSGAEPKWRVAGACVVASDVAPGEGRIVCISPAAISFVQPAECWAANAHLISAAPELLEALVLIVGELDQLPISHPQWPGSPLRFRAAAAIAKATGESK